MPKVSTSRPPIKWWGWGDPHCKLDPPAGFLSFLFQRLGIDPVERRASPSTPPKLSIARKTGLGLEHIQSDDERRLPFATGRSYLDLVRLRRGSVLEAPDAVFFPADENALIRSLQQKHSAIVPFGGGTSVVGGVAPQRGKHDSVVALDLSRFNRILEIDATAGTVEAEAGVFGPALEHALRSHGLSLHHFPQSFEYSTVGGWIASNSAGQESTLYGRVKDMVLSLRYVTPSGLASTLTVPASAAGPSLVDMLVGSEGTLGVILSATLRVCALPEKRVYRSYLFSSFAEGIETTRQILQSGVVPAIIRLSDEEETALSLQLHPPGIVARKVLGWLGKNPGSHLLIALDGSGSEVRTQEQLVGSLARRQGGFPAGSGPGKKWETERFLHPYLRDSLLDYGFFVETFETATTWTLLPQLCEHVRREVAGIVAVHLSHAYRSGASLYFTVIAHPSKGAEEEMWNSVKTATLEAIRSNGGTVSHHHGIGMYHSHWIGQEIGAQGTRALRALKNEFDPHGILNPEKLLP